MKSIFEFFDELQIYSFGKYLQIFREMYRLSFDSFFFILYILSIRNVG